MAQITFINTMGVQEEFAPQPATSLIPDWYKNMDSYVGGEKVPNGEGRTTGTIKRCMPVFDVIVHGYIITTYADIFVSQKEQPTLDNDDLVKQPWYQWSSSESIQFHSVQQAPTHPAKNDISYPKFINSWGIKTPPGYSTLFMAPVHRENIFTILPGVVDTDTYTAPVNFPMVLTNIKFEGLIPAGTPIAQVVPFKRESWTMNLGKQEDIEAQYKVVSKLRTKIFDSYKTQFRQIKEYK